VVLSSTQSPRCSGDHFPGDTRSSLGSTHFVSDRLLLGLVCSANMPFAKFSAVCSSELEKMAAKVRQKSLDPQRAQRRNSLSDINT
jgi:hypothetical protein